MKSQDQLEAEFDVMDSLPPEWRRVAHEHGLKQALIMRRKGENPVPGSGHTKPIRKRVT